MADLLIGVLLDDAALDIAQLAHACDVDTDWVVARVQAGVLEAAAGPPDWRFSGAALRRARRLLSLERDFDADEELAALVLDLADEVGRLRTRLRVLGAG